MDLTECLDQFRLASRELFNRSFRVSTPYPTTQEVYELAERFEEIEILLFEKMVIERAKIANVEYGYGFSSNPNILVRLPHNYSAPFRLNREINSGYWDDPVKEFSNQAVLHFVSFFDEDRYRIRDNGLVMVEVKEWNEQPQTVGKRALIQTDYVIFVRGDQDTSEKSIIPQFK